MSDVRLEDLTKTFKSTTAVDHIDLVVEEGAFFSLLGPSGCGKTTTLRMIGGFEEPSGGTVYLGGHDVTDLPPYRREVNTVFQSYALFPHLNVFDNVAFGLKRKKAGTDSIRSAVGEMLSLVDLEGYDKRKINQLSGGQQQRVALARALVNSPEVLLLDEPLGALDLKLRKQMQLELKRIQSELKITFIYVTHDQEEAMTMSNCIAVMRAGRFEQVGAPQEVYELPATEFVASFLGASNLLDGQVDSAEGSVAKVALAAGSTVSLPARRLPETRGPLRVGVRPEKLYILPADEAAPDQGDNIIEATVSISTYTGVSTSYECRTPDGAKVVVYAQNLGARKEVFPSGAKVRLSWHPEHTFAVRDNRQGEEREAQHD
jgi:spermidine/putrescine transport system ATP-binding protein